MLHRVNARHFSTLTLLIETCPKVVLGLGFNIGHEGR